VQAHIESVFKWRGIDDILAEEMSVLDRERSGRSGDWRSRGLCGSAMQRAYLRGVGPAFDAVGEGPEALAH